MVRREFEYERQRTCALLGGLDVASGEVVGEVVPLRDADALVRDFGWVLEPIV